jgi:platelet-activating factor acetylhydrolase
MLYKLDELANFLRGSSWLPAPAGQLEVGYVDIMTEGLPAQSDYLRLYYPTEQKHQQHSERCHIWSSHDVKHGFINFIKAQVHSWPSWANNSEFGFLGIGKFVNRYLGSCSFRTIFSLGWNLICSNPKVPVVHQAQPAKPPSGKWPVVVFSHGMGCNRYAYSKICYDLCSEGFIVASVEHRDGSACHSKYFNDNQMEEIVHLQLEPSDCEHKTRSEQVHQRAKEVDGCLDILKSLNKGVEPVNILQTEQGYHLSDFTGRLDLDKLYMMGHSFGGSTALLAASKDDLFKGIICIDPWMFPVSEEKFSVHKPVLLINTEAFAHEKNVEKVQEVCSDVNAKVLQGAVHLVHTDAPFLLENDLYKSGLGMLCTRGTIEVLKENHSIIKSWIFSMMNGEQIERTLNWGI